jgi:hypothetical protein
MNFKVFTEGKKLRNKLRFVRYGGLSPVKQLGFGKDTFHAPPARRGIYAFPWPYIERFLLTVDDMATGELHPKFQFVKDPKGNKISNLTHPELFNKYSEIDNYYTFSKTQLAATRKADSGDWSKDTIDATDWDKHEHFIIELKKPRIFTYEGPIWHHLDTGVGIKRGEWVKTDIDEYRAALKRELHRVKRDNFSKDHLEVFIERL